MSELFRIIQAYVESTPEKIVFSSLGDGRSVTWRELDMVSGKVYRYLKAHGIGREDIVNIFLPRGVEPLIAMLGVWKAGAAFVLLEQEYPAERIAFIRKDCGCKLVLDSAAWEEALQCEYLAGFAEANEHDAAFAVYTPGTTGNPKCVLHEYGNIDYIAKSLYENGENPLKEYDNFAMIAPLYFVVAVIAYVAILDAGIRLSIVPFSIAKNPPALSKAFVENKVDSLFCAPSILRIIRNMATRNGKCPNCGYQFQNNAPRMLTLLASFAQEESRSISENARWAIQKRFEQGIPNGKFRIYGYRWEDDRLVPVPEEAAIVRRIFQNFLDGKSRLETEREFAAEGITTRDGCRWVDSNIKVVLSNVTYTGNLLLQKEFIEDPLTKKRRKNKGQLPQYYVENTHECCPYVNTNAPP